MLVRTTLALVLALLIVGCAEIEHSSRLVQPLDKPLVAGVGDTIIEIDLRESLPNVFGKSDIFGRTRPRGKVFVTYLGLKQGRAVFERYTIRQQSTATTMNSTPLIIPQTSTTTYAGSTNVSGSMPGGPFFGTAVSSGISTTNAPPIVIPPSGSETRVISNNRIRYFLNLVQSRKLVVEGHEIFIEDAEAASVKYRIKKLN